MIPLYIALGGALGALARFSLGGWIATWAGAGFPWATLAINAAGSLFLGLLMQALPGSGAETGMRALLAVGFCGSFTTFSTFGYEAVALLQRNAPGTAGAYVLASVGLGVLGVWTGFYLGRLFG